MKNIAIVIGNITNAAGTERAVTNLANMLVKHGSYNVSVISVTSQNGDRPYYIFNSKVLIKHLNIDLTFRLKGYFKLIKKMKKIIKELKLDYIIGTTHAINILLTFLNKRLKKIGCEHMNYAACPKISALFRRYFYKKLDSIVLLTQADAKHYYFLDQNKVYVIPNSLSFTCEYAAPLENKRIISVGRLTKQKGFDLLIKAAEYINKSLPDWRIDIFGSGEEKQNLQNLISEKKLENYVFINEPVKDIKNELLNSSLYVMSSRWEGLPMILLEAKSCGLPIVSFNCPEGPSDVIKNGQDGILIKPEEIQNLASTIVSLCKDKNKLKNYGMAAYVNSKDFSEENIYEKWKKLL